MSNFTVELQPDAIDDLANIWMRSPNPSAITRADAIANQLFHTDPYKNATYVAEEMYKLIIPPLVYFFSVTADVRHVSVGAIREIRS